MQAFHVGLSERDVQELLADYDDVPMMYPNDLDESQRQIIQLALFQLQARRPGWDYAIGEIVKKLGGPLAFPEESKELAPLRDEDKRQLFLWKCYQRQARAIAKFASDGFVYDADRASGLCVCEMCGLNYYDHPSIDSDCPTLVMVCDGTVYKL